MPVLGPRPILTAEQMRAAERQAIETGTLETGLMEKAGRALAEAVRLYAGPRETLILCGPGNNGGDGYVAARYLAEAGYAVRVAALAEPAAEAARWASSQWKGSVEPFASAREAPILIDCLFGTGLGRPLDTAAVNRLGELANAALVSVACDLPSGVDADSGEELSAVPRFDLTVTFGALKPAHRLMPAMAHCGRVVLADIGIDAPGNWSEIAAPFLIGPHPASHKYSRGMVVIIPGAMPGAAALAAAAALRSGAGFVRLDTRRAIGNVPAAVVQGQAGDLSDPRIGTILIGPGLGRRGGSMFRKSAGWLVRKALESGRPMVIDGDALRLIEPERCQGAILTPHEGEFTALFGKAEGSKPQRALAAARRSQAVIVYKGPDTLVASPDGQLAFAPPAPPWLASAGTGDVLAGMAAGLRAQGHDPFRAATAAVWLHGRAAEIAGPGLIADDLIEAIPHALAECR
jgi:ADP-dependent NAD(P)H-hydrate dehydratase / NAD(P)H-hydrate epimerase